MKRFFKALLFTCLCVIAIVCGCYVLYLWFQFTSNLNVGFWIQLLIYLTPSIILIVVSIFLEIYNQLSRETNSDKKELISDWDKEFYERTKEILKDKTMGKEVVCNWIPVSESLPDEGRLFNEYLITVTRWSDVVCDWIEDDVILSKFYGGKFDICRCFWEDGHQPIVKAWMELPEPYKFEG